jgi:hypothetical protein
VSLLPEEHGAYGQIALPLLTALVVAGISTPGLLVTTATVAGFLAHEPAVVLIGLRGPRARRELRRHAVQWLGCCVAVAAGAGLGALVTIDAASRWTLAVPLVPAFLLVVATIRGREKSWYGEAAAALAFAGAAVPVSIAAGATLRVAATVAIPFALLFVASTLAVRVVILRVRRGGDVRAARATRLAALALAAVAIVALAVAAVIEARSSSILVASVPGLVTAAGIAAHPPAATSLRPLGWTLVAVSLVTGAIVVVTA